MAVKHIEIQYKPNAHELFVNEVGDWVDLYTYEDVYLKEGESTLIDLGVAMKLPKGYEGYVVPRSSTFKRWGVLQTNGFGELTYFFLG